MGFCAFITDFMRKYYEMRYNSSMAKNDKPKRVLVVLANTKVNHRLYLEGILSYAKDHTFPRWQVILGLRNLNKAMEINPALHGFDAVIAAVHNPADRAFYYETGLPTVLFEPTIKGTAIPRPPGNVVLFLNDHSAEGRVAAEYFLSRGYSSFAFVGTPEATAWSDSRLEGYRALLAHNGFPVKVYGPPPKREQSNFMLEAPRLVRFLSSLPPGTAVFAAHDERALQILSCARIANLPVPERFSVLGVDNDALLCTTALPPISSIEVEAKENGYRFAKALDDLISNRPTESIVRTSHTHIVTRRSTDAFALADVFLSRALAYYAANLAARPHIGDLAHEAKCSIRTLQLKALKILGHPLKDELKRIQTNEARRRLATATATPATIARECGFCSTGHMNRRLRD